MSRLCRLKTASHGDDGKWAYNEIVSLRKQRDELLLVLEELIELCVPSFCSCDPEVGYRCRACTYSSSVNTARAVIASVKGEQ